MATAQIAYETETGRILMVHLFLGDPGDERDTRQDAAYLTDVAPDSISMMSVPADEMDENRSYKVDTSRNTLIETAAGEDSVRSSFTEVRPPS